MSLHAKARTFINVVRREGPRPAFRSVSEEAKRSVLGDRSFRYMTIARYHTQRLLYDAPAHPYKTIRVRPDRIAYYNKEIEPHWGLGVIKGGEWDRLDNCQPVKHTTHYTGLRQRFEEGLHWEDTAYVQRRLLNGESGCLSDHQRKRVEYFEDLFYDIKRNGYRSNSSSGHDAPEGGNRRGDLEHVHALEVLVTIGRDGELYLNDGFHRCAIATFLDIDEIPVNVLARHEEWQRKREAINAASDADAVPGLSEYVSHPDMGDVAPD